MRLQTVNMMAHVIDHIVSDGANRNRIVVRPSGSFPHLIRQILKKDDIRPVEIGKFFEQIGETDCIEIAVSDE